MTERELSAAVVWAGDKLAELLGVQPFGEAADAALSPLYPDVLAVQ